MSANQRTALLSVAIAFSLICTWQLAGAQGEKVKVVQKWEYLVETNTSAAKRNEFGREGWELVAVTTGINSTQTCYFKRPVE